MIEFFKKHFFTIYFGLILTAGTMLIVFQSIQYSRAKRKLEEFKKFNERHLMFEFRYEKPSQSYHTCD